MGNCKKIYFIFLSFILFTQISFAGKTAAVSVPVVAKQHFLTAVYKHLPVSAQADNQMASLHNIFFAQNAIEDALVKKVCKLKKKYKRVQPGSSSLRVPVRDVDIIPQNIYIKETYSKPFFISPLHRFLFRLTPF